MISHTCEEEIERKMLRALMPPPHKSSRERWSVEQGKAVERAASEMATLRQPCNAERTGSVARGLSGRSCTPRLSRGNYPDSPALFRPSPARCPHEATSLPARIAV